MSTGMTYKVAIQEAGKLEILDEATIEATSALDALREFASDRGFDLEKESFDFEEYGQSLMEERDGTQLSVI